MPDLPPGELLFRKHIRNSRANRIDLVYGMKWRDLGRFFADPIYQSKLSEQLAEAYRTRSKHASRDKFMAMKARFTQIEKRIRTLSNCSSLHQPTANHPRSEQSKKAIAETLASVIKAV